MYTCLLFGMAHVHKWSESPEEPANSALGGMRGILESERRARVIECMCCCVSDYTWGDRAIQLSDARWRVLYNCCWVPTILC